MKVELNLTIRRKWFDMIDAGKKREEYRDCMQRQTARAYVAAINHPCWGWYVKPVAILRNGYTMESRALAVEIRGWDLRGPREIRHPEWGEQECKRSHIVVKLGDILARGTYAEVKRQIGEGARK